ncbi:MAG: ABC transporter ATP-binding protein [Eubacteriales bacterium]|nr:ABC transporter ATP-binding protein [Eubacteriales bacterium]
MRKFLKGFSFHKTGWQVLKIAHQVDSTMIPASILDAVLKLICIYAELFLSAALIDALLEGGFERAGILALMLMSIHFGIGCVNHFLARMFAGQKTRCDYAFYVMLRKKALSLDYETMENPEVADRILLSEQSAMMYGGMGNMVGYYLEVLQSLLTMAASLTMIAIFCIQRPLKAEGIWRAAAAPACTAILLTVLFLANGIFAGKISARFSEIQKKNFENHAGVENKLEYLAKHIFMNYQAGKVIRIFDMKEMLLKNAREEQEKVKNYYERSCAAELQENMSYLAANSVFHVISYFLVALKVVAGAVSVGSFMKYAGALNQFGSAYTTLVTKNGMLRNCCTYMEEFLAFLEQESAHASGSIPVEKRIDGEYEIAFEDVSFHYPGSGEMVLKHVNCKLDMKHKMALVGRNGAGKTTFIKLLCRLYEPTEGRITLNGVDIRKYDEEQYRDLFGVVFQDFKLFAFPVWENIAAGYKRDDEKLWKALRQAGADEMVKSMPDQLETWLYKNIEDGVEISGGEAQKLVLARALYKDAALVILDEPTAALDPMAEAEIYAGFNAMVEGKTSVYISHRMSSCRFCDDIIVLEEGGIAERGSHEKLLAEEGQYARMWNAQAKYYA